MRFANYCEELEAELQIERYPAERCNEPACPLHSLYRDVYPFGAL